MEHTIRKWSRLGKLAPPSPQTAEDRAALCGAMPDPKPERPDLDPFFIAGQTESGAGKSARLWLPFSKVTGHTPDLTPQPTGNCVAAAADDVVEFTECIEIVNGEAEEFRPIYNPFHYFTGRELIGGGRLRGSAGSVGGWQAKAIRDYGVLWYKDGLPKYNRRNVDAWGDGRSAEGQSPRDFMETAAERTIRTISWVPSWDLLRDALYHYYASTIASRRGYTMKPGRDGFHAPSGTWNHQMSVMGYSEEGPEKDHWAAVKNQWGDVHGEARTPQGDLLPPGFLLVRLDRFVTEHLGLRGCETIAYSGFNGFPAKNRRKVDHKIKGWETAKHHIKWG